MEGYTAQWRLCLVPAAPLPAACLPQGLLGGLLRRICSARVQCALHVVYMPWRCLLGLPQGSLACCRHVTTWGTRTCL